MRRLYASGLTLALALTATAARAADDVQITSDSFGGLTARALGPGTMSGRISAIDAVPSDPLTIYVGAAGGGVWKSIDGTNTFKPIFDDHTQSIGAIRVDPTDPKTVWVGTGEPWVRNSVSIGDGIYKSTDGGDNWTRMGLADTERVSRIQVDPKNHDTVFVCATGHLWNANEERGVFKTTDGGKTWKKVLYVDADTGCSDLAIDPQEPRILYAGMWTYRRYPDFFDSGGMGSGLFKSIDGGETWTRLDKDLPKRPVGRVAVSVAPSRPSVVYSVVEAKEGKKQTTALYRSDDAGASWTKMSDAAGVQIRPFYFAAITVDPQDFNRIYKPGWQLTISNDGGKSFTSFFTSGFGSGYHGDVHDVWVHPQRTNEVYLATDGGLYLSRNRGSDWSFARNLPVGQFYKVAVDDQDPYFVYGGLQDNNCWIGPSESWGGIENKDWLAISGGDGFATFADGADPKYVFASIQGGLATRVDLRTGESKDIQPFAGKGEKELRFNWNAAFVASPTDKSTIYIGSQFLMRSRDRGESWERISPDLTTNDPKRQRQKQSGGLTLDNSSAENNATIYSISESPRDANVLWVGTDDGNVQVSRDAGKTWTNVVDKIPGVAKGVWVSHVAASPHDAATAYVTIDDHRRGDMRPQLFRTRDFGATWESLARPEIEGYAWVLIEDTVDPQLLYLGTEWGLWISIDGGAHWARFKGGLPERVAVHDLAIQQREGDLVIGTHGRGIYILDDLTPLRAMTAETLAQDVAFLPSRPAQQTLRAAIGFSFGGGDEFVGPNPSEDAAIVYWLKKRHLFGDLKLEIYDADGKLVTTLPGGKRVGLNRVAWPMRMKPPKVPPAANILFGGFEGPRNPEGTYRVKLIKGKSSFDSTVTLVADPRNPHSAEDRKLKSDTELRLYADIERLAYVGDGLVAVRDTAKARKEKASGRLAAQLGQLADDADSLRESFVAADVSYFGGDDKLREFLGNLYGGVLNFEGRPSPSQLERAKNLEADLAAVEKRFQEFQAKSVAPVNASLAKAKLDAIEVSTFEAWKAKDEAGAGKGGGAALEPEQVEELQARLPWLTTVASGFRLVD